MPIGQDIFGTGWDIPERATPAAPSQWFGWGALPPAVMEDEQLRSLWILNELIPYMTPDAQKAAMGQIFGNIDTLIDAGYFAGTGGQPYDQRLEQYRKAPVTGLPTTRDWWENLQRGATAAHYGGAALGSGSLGVPGANPFWQLGENVNQLAGQPATYRNVMNTRRTLEQGLQGLPEGFAQLGQYLMNPERAQVRAVAPGYSYGGQRTSWWT